MDGGDIGAIILLLLVFGAGAAAGWKITLWYSKKQYEDVIALLNTKIAYLEEVNQKDRDHFKAREADFKLTFDTLNDGLKTLNPPPINGFI